MNTIEYSSLIKNLINYIKEKPDGYTVSTFQLLIEVGIDVEKYDSGDLFRINTALFDAAVEEHILLDMSAHEDMDEGLPYHLDFIVRQPGTIKSVCLISSKRYNENGTDLMAEVEQKLTINDTGQVLFTARNYNQCKNGDGYCRKKKLDIGSWKADFLIRIVENLMDNTSYKPDEDSYKLEVEYSNGIRSNIDGKLDGNVISHVYGDTDNVDVTRLFRRYIPVFGLWAFDSSLSPDYEGKKAIYIFAEQWKNFFENPNSSLDFELDFGNQCECLGFQMDGNEKFVDVCRKYGCLKPFQEDMTEALKNIDDIDIIGSGLFSYWRYLTHWCFMYQLDDEVCGHFLALLDRIKELTRKKV